MNDGLEVLEEFDNYCDIKMVIVDYCMFNMDGYELVKVICYEKCM